MMGERNFQSSSNQYDLGLDLSDLRKCVVERIEFVLARLFKPPDGSVIMAIDDILEMLDQIIEGVMCLDSYMRLPEDIYVGIGLARKLIKMSRASSSRTPSVSTGTPGRPMYDITE